MIVLNRKTMGFTLIEAAVIIMLLSIALIPIVKMAAFKDADDSGNGAMTGASSGKLLSREKAVANTIMEKAIAGDYMGIQNPVIVSVGAADCVGQILSFQYDPTSGKFKVGILKDDGTFDDTKTFSPAAGIGTTNPTTGLTEQKYEFPKYRYGTSEVYYSWAIEDSTLQQYTPLSGTYAGTAIYGSFMPKGNSLNKAILKVYTGSDAAVDGSSPDYVLSTYFYKNTAENAGGADQFTDTIGIVLALDVSLSMRMSNFVGQGVFDYVPGSVTGKPFLDNIAPLGTVKVPMRMSSGVMGYDPYAVASPYLVYRPGVKDLFFSKAVDDPVTTQYDERYDPCYAAQATPLLMASYPATASDTLSTTGTYAQVITNCSAPSPVLPTGVDAEKILVSVPTMPSSTIRTAITTAGASTAFVAETNNWGGAGVSTEEWVYGDACLKNPVETSDCPYVLASGTLLKYPGGAGFNAPVPVLDTQSTNRVIASLFGNPGDSNLTQATLSRIEAARTAMLAFVLTIENNAALVDNFRLGLVPFSTVVNDGNSYLGVTYPDEVVSIKPPNASGEFDFLKRALYRLNRACNDGVYNYGSVNVASCPTRNPDDTGPVAPPFTLTGNTNIAQALLYSQEQFKVFDPADNKLAAKLVILLTDGGPTESATTWNSPGGVQTPASAEKARIDGYVTDLHNDGIDIYTVGLLVGSDANAIALVDGIGAAYPGNMSQRVESVADLSPIFENIAQQAERLLLQAMKDRYQYLDY